MRGVLWLSAGTISLVLASCGSPASDRSDRATQTNSMSQKSQGTTSAEEEPDTVPPADVSHGEARIGGPNATPAPVKADLPPAKQTRLHRVRLEMNHTPVDIAPGVRYAAWTFGGTVPGPAMRVRQGDTVDFTLVNRANVPHSMDFHAAEIAPNKYYVNVMPGDSLSYRFVARIPGAYMYHCGTAPAAMHIANGMYGAIIVDPVRARPRAREFVLVQSEFYITPKAAADGTRGLDWERLLSRPRSRRLQRQSRPVCFAAAGGASQRAGPVIPRECRAQPNQLVSCGGRDLRAGLPGRLYQHTAGGGSNGECSSGRWEHLRAAAARVGGLSLCHPRIRGCNKRCCRGAAGGRAWSLIGRELPTVFRVS